MTVEGEKKTKTEKLKGDKIHKEKIFKGWDIPNRTQTKGNDKFKHKY